MPIDGHQSDLSNGTLKSVLLDLAFQPDSQAAAVEPDLTMRNNNEEIQREHQITLETFRQQIHELETERRMLQIRLETVENDYELQIKELQNNINSMRIDVQMQKKMYRQLESDRLSVISELTQQNQSMAERLRANAKTEARLKQELNQLRSQCNQRKSSMHDNLHLIGSLRQEIAKLRADKSTLETKLQVLTEERNQLADMLTESNQRADELEQLQQEQLATIHSQDGEIAHLQERANRLQEHLHNLSTQQANSQFSEDSNSLTRPHHSLLAELAEQRLDFMCNAPLGAFDGRASCLNDDDDDGVEMDDDTILAYVAAQNSEHHSTMTEPIPSTSSNYPSNPMDPSDLTIINLRLEVAEIYRQMHQMCVEVQALSEAHSGTSVMPNGGAKTPDELAMVEMDFRLSSLRSVLGDLRGLLRELGTDLSYTKKPNTNLEDDDSPAQLTKTGTGINGSEATLEAQCQTSAQDPEDLVGTMLNERNALVNEVATAQQRLSNLQKQIEDEAQQLTTKNSETNRSLKRTNFIANWQELDDEEYEFEMPQEPIG